MFPFHAPPENPMSSPVPGETDTSSRETASRKTADISVETAKREGCADEHMQVLAPWSSDYLPGHIASPMSLQDYGCPVPETIPPHLQTFHLHTVKKDSTTSPPPSPPKV